MAGSLALHPTEQQLYEATQDLVFRASSEQCLSDIPVLIPLWARLVRSEVDTGWFDLFYEVLYHRRELIARCQGYHGISQELSLGVMECIARDSHPRRRVDWYSHLQGAGVLYEAAAGVSASWGAQTDISLAYLKLVAGLLLLPKSELPFTPFYWFPPVLEGERVSGWTEDAKLALMNLLLPESVVTAFDKYERKGGVVRELARPVLSAFHQNLDAYEAAVSDFIRRL